jgi:ATPase family AAA domain-containing protein 3A/B
MSNNSEGASKESRGMYGFDPSGLERAAEAAKILDNSKNSKNAFEMALKEEEVKLAKEKRLLKEQEIYHTRMDQEERRKTMQQEMEIQKEKARYDDYLAKDRINYRLQRERESNEENLKKQEESIRKQEALKQASLEYEHQLKLRQDRERMINKFNVKSEVERKNFDLTEKKIKIKEGERRATSKEIALIGFQMAGQGIREFINDKNMMLKVFSGLTLTYVFAYGCKSTINFIYKYLSSRLMTPKLIRETSRIPINSLYMYPIKFFNHFIYTRKKDILEGIILKPELEQQLRIISNAIINKKKHYAPFRNLLFHGPPGTGKTLFAKQLAKRSGLDFAILTGADVAPLGPNAVSELHKIFDWSETSKNGKFILK